MKLTNVETRYRFEFDPGTTVVDPDGDAFELASAEVTVTPIDDDETAAVELIEVRFRGYTLTVTGRRLGVAPREIHPDVEDVERALAERVREIRSSTVPATRENGPRL